MFPDALAHSWRVSTERLGVEVYGARTQNQLRKLVFQFHPSHPRSHLSLISATMQGSSILWQMLSDLDLHYILTSTQNGFSWVLWLGSQCGEIHHLTQDPTHFLQSENNLGIYLQGKIPEILTPWFEILRKEVPGN